MQLNYASYGEGYPLLILHGLFGSWENWQTLSRRLAQCYHVLALDLRNHGHSPHDPIMNYVVMADDLHEFMEAQRLSSAYLLGHSMGGKVAMQFALTRPEKVEKLVVVDITPKAYAPQLDPIFRALSSLDIKSFRTRRDADQALAGQISDRALRQFLLKNLIRSAGGGFKWQFDLDSIYRNYGEIDKSVETAGRFDKPALFIRGENSDYIDESDIPLIKRMFPYSRIVTVPGVGHWVQAEARARFARLVVAFLGQV